MVVPLASEPVGDGRCLLGDKPSRSVHAEQTTKTLTPPQFISYLPWPLAPIRKRGQAPTAERLPGMP